MRTFNYEESFKITNRGTVYTGHMPDPPFTVEEEVIIDGDPRVIVGIERHCVDWGLDPGQPIGLLVKP